MTKYKVMAKQPEARDPELLDRVPMDNGDGTTTVPYDVNAPGLYPDETAVTLESGDIVAVSVEPKWMENGQGVALHGFARWIDTDGTTHETDQGQVVETSVSVTVDQATLQKHSLQKLAGEVAKILLGEEPETQAVHTDPGEPKESRPIVDVADEVRLNADISNGIKNAKAVARLSLKL